MTSFYVGVVAVLAFNTALLAVLTWAHGSPRFSGHRISDRPGMKVAWSKRLQLMAVISTLSLAMVVGFSVGAHHVLISAGDEPAWRVGVQAVLVLVLYDFLYYFLHRTLHHKKLMRSVHGVHHRARNPSALESFYLHPIELGLGLGLLFFCTWAVGPIHPVAFLFAFFVYSNLNIIIHAGLDLPGLLLKPTSYLTRKHHVHHQDDFSKNYGSLSPLPDLIFGTAG